MLSNSQNFKDRLYRSYTVEPVTIAHHVGDLLGDYDFNPRQVRVISRSIDKLIDIYLERHPELDGDEYILEHEVEVNVIDGMSFDITVKLSEHLHFQVQYDTTRISDLDEIAEDPYLLPKASYSPYLHAIPALKLIRQEDSDCTVVNVVEYAIQEDHVVARFMYPTMHEDLGHLHPDFSKNAGLTNRMYAMVIDEPDSIILNTNDISLIRRVLAKHCPDNIDAVINNLPMIQSVLKDSELRPIYLYTCVVKIPKKD